MTSAILNEIGLGNLDPGYLFIGLLALILILLILWIVQMSKTKKLAKRLDRFMVGKSGESLEEEIGKLFEDNEYLKDAADSNRKEIKNIYRKMRFTYQKLGIVKYDAFKQMGGMLSFSLALLNEDDDGFIINSVHSSDGCYSYTKEITKGECALALGEEEQQALELAMNEKQRKKEDKKSDEDTTETPDENTEENSNQDVKETPDDVRNCHE